METRIFRSVISHLTGKVRRRATIVAMTVAAVAAAVVLASPAGASPIAPKAASAIKGTEHFQIMTTSGSATTAGVILTGVILTYGTDHENTSNAKTSTDLFTFAGGSFKVTHTTKSQSQTVNLKACFFGFSEKGTFKLSGGTGKYKGIGGSGTFTATGEGFGPKTNSGACNQNANPIVFQQVIDATGSVKLP